MMDVFYEESATNQNAKKGEKTYKVLHWLNLIFIWLGIIVTIIAFMCFPLKPKEGNYDSQEIFEQAMINYYAALYFFLILVGILLFFYAIGIIFFWFKRKVNISYDYIFVSGDLRIAKIFNINKRKFLITIHCDDILQIGDVENSSYDRLAASPDVKTTYLTQNETPSEGKFFMYILVGNGGKALYVLECREELLMNIMKFTRRSALESDYVMQEKKQKKV